MMAAVWSWLAATSWSLSWLMLWMPSCSKAPRPASKVSCFVSKVCTDDRSRPKSSDRTWVSLSAIQLSTTSAFHMNWR
uniref:Putative secreted protein n=1 Tax=Ixodes ricinus TaxID=34613 RepID=A0A6B0U0E0_IXORI